LPLTVHQLPLSVSFAIFNPALDDIDETNKTASVPVALVDPSWEEERLDHGQLTFVLYQSGEIASIVKSGGDPVPITQIQDDSLVLARSIAKTYHAALQTALSILI